MTTTNRLAKLYEHLSPRERLPLIIAAGVRNDEVERERLIGTAPRLNYRIKDFHGLADSLQTVTHRHLARVLHLGAHFWRLLWLADSEGWRAAMSDKPDAFERVEDLDETVGGSALLVTTEIDGWAHFCKELVLDPQALLRQLREFETYSEMESDARRMACTPDEAAAWLSDKADEPWHLPTVEGVARIYRELLAFGDRSLHSRQRGRLPLCKHHRVLQVQGRIRPDLARLGNRRAEDELRGRELRHQRRPAPVTCGRSSSAPTRWCCGRWGRSGLTCSVSTRTPGRRSSSN